MADYIGIKGVHIPIVSSDPSNLTAGEIWYNTTSNTLKAYGAQGTGAWSSGTATPTAMFGGNAAGTNTAALTWGGYFPPASPSLYRDLTFEWDGSSWTSGGAYPIGFQRGWGWGTQTAAMGAGGYGPSSYQDVSNTYDGSTWTSGPTMNTARGYSSVGFGPTTAAVAVNGNDPGGRTSYVEEFNGTSWTEVTNTPAVGSGGGGAGTTTAGLSFLGSDTPGAGGRVATSNAYDGTSWTATNACNSSRTGVGASGATQANAMAYGGGPGPDPYSTYTEQFDGTSWTEVADLSTQRQAIYAPLGGGTQLASMAIMGDTGVGNTIVEEWAVPDATKTVTSS